MSVATASTAMTPGKLSPLGTRSPERVIARGIDSASGEGVLIADAVGAATEAAEDRWTAGTIGFAEAAAHSASVATAAREIAADKAGESDSEAAGHDSSLLWPTDCDRA